MPFRLWAEPKELEPLATELSTLKTEFAQLKNRLLSSDTEALRITFSELDDARNQIHIIKTELLPKVWLGIEAQLAFTREQMAWDRKIRDDMRCKCNDFKRNQQGATLRTILTHREGRRTPEGRLARLHMTRLLPSIHWLNQMAVKRIIDNIKAFAMCRSNRQFAGAVRKFHRRLHLIGRAGLGATARVS